MTTETIVGRQELEDQSRAALRTRQISKTIPAVWVLDRFWVVYDPADESLTPCLLRDGFWESWLTLAIMRDVRPGWRCVDVGANVGYFSLLLADLVGDAGHVLAIEPQQDLARMLRVSGGVNDVTKRLQVWEGAASDHSGDEALLLYGDLRGSASFEVAKGYTPTESVRVYTQTLDALTVGWSGVDFVKIDAEGAEPAIWAGMQGVLDRNPQCIVAMEVADNREYNLPEFLREIEKDGFPLRYVAHDGEIAEGSEEHMLGIAEELPTLWLQRSE